MANLEQVKKTLHLNTNLDSHKLILAFFEAAKAGRPFSAFAKDILYEQALVYFTGNGGQVGITPAIASIAVTSPETPKFKPIKQGPSSQPKEPEAAPKHEETPVVDNDVNSALDNAVDIIW